MNYNDNNLCLWVRFFACRFKGKQGLKLQKTFKFSHYDYDYDKTLAAAQAWRDDQLAKNPQLVNVYKSRQKLHRTKLFKNNKTGVVGVHFSWKKDDAGKPAYPHYTVTWMYTEDDKRRNGRKDFFYKKGDKQGKKLAFEQAVAYRKQMELIHYTGQF